MKSTWWRSPVGLRVASLLFPPAGLVLLWTSSRNTGAKILGTLGLILFSVLYAAVVICALLLFTDFQVEWRGGYIPALTRHKTGPDYEALERDRTTRAGQKAEPAISDRPGNVYWTGFRGKNRNGHYDEM